jgi:hypothetical protein
MADSLFVGTIAASAPDYGVVLVSRGHTTIGLGDLVIAHLPYSDGQFGAVPKIAFPTGTDVLCWQNESSSHLAYVLGAANKMISDNEEYTGGNLLYHIDKFLTGDARAFEDMLNGLISQYRTYFRNHSQGADRDILPGDFDALDREGLAGLHVGRLLATLRGSSVSCIDVSSLTNAIRSIGVTIEEHTLRTERVVDNGITANNRALSTSEAFGLRTGAIMEQSPDGTSLSPVNPSAIPLYRFQSVEGEALHGSEDLVVSFPQDTEVHDSGTEPPILARERTDLGGAISKASSQGILMAKTPLIPGIHQLGYGEQSAKSPDSGTFYDLREPYEAGDEGEETTEEKDASPEEKVDDAALNKLIETLLSEDYKALLKEKLAAKGLKLSTIDSSIYGKMEEPDEISGITTEAAYPLPKTLTLVDPATGNEQLYYASASFISQESDGSILICDGYGSEIRMSRGNIYIASALDTFIRPGRDLSAMVPRHQSFNSQGSCTINSSDAMFVRAVNSLKIAGATGGTGVVTLESKSTQAVDVPGGLVIKSNSNLSVTGKDLYIGRNAHEGKAQNRVTEPEEQGMIILDAGSNGTILERSLAHTMDSMEVTVGSLQGYSNAALVVRQGNIGLLARYVQIPANVAIQGLNGLATVSVYRDGDMVDLALTTSSVCGVTVNGSMIVDKDFQVNDSMKVVNTLLAKKIGSTSELNGLIESKEADKVFRKEGLGSSVAPSSVGRTVSGMLKQRSNTLYQDYFVTGNQFSFPKDYGISSTLRFPGMVWQARDFRYSTSEVVWTEQYIKDANNEETACYPGYNVWEEATLSVTGYETKKLKDSYVINAERTPVR